MDITTFLSQLPPLRPEIDFPVEKIKTMREFERTYQDIFEECSAFDGYADTFLWQLRQTSRTEDNLADLADRYVGLYGQAEDLIDKVPDPNERVILEYRHSLGWSWELTAKQPRKSVDGLKDLYDRPLPSVEIEYEEAFAEDHTFVRAFFMP